MIQNYGKRFLQTSTSLDCDKVVQESTLYAVMCYSGSATILTTAISFVVKYIGKKKLTLMIFAMSTSAGIALLLIKIPILSILVFIIFLDISFILGNMNTYLVELNPTHLRFVYLENRNNIITYLNTLELGRPQIVLHKIKPSKKSKSKQIQRKMSLIQLDSNQRPRHIALPIALQNEFYAKSLKSSLVIEFNNHLNICSRTSP